MKVKNFILLMTIFAVMHSCKPYKQIGSVNMISTRNVDSKLNYKLISAYTGGSKDELKKSKAKSIEEAIDETVKKIPGGEFLMNAKIYIVREKYIGVEGDVWGNPDAAKQVAFNGFKQGDRVTWKRYGKFVIGEITALKVNSCLVKKDNNGKTYEVDYNDLTLIK